MTTNNDNQTTQTESTETPKLPGCLTIFIGLFLIVWAVMFIGLGINFVYTMVTVNQIQQECIKNGNCPTLQVQPDGKGGSIVRPTFPTPDQSERYE